MIHPQTPFDLQLNKIENHISRAGYKKVLKNAVAEHNDELVYIQYSYLELPEEVEETEVDMSLLRQWIKNEYPELTKPYKRNGEISWYHLIEIEFCKWMQEQFFKHACNLNLI